MVFIPFWHSTFHIVILLIFFVLSYSTFCTHIWLNKTTGALFIGVTSIPYPAGPDSLHCKLSFLMIRFITRIFSSFSQDLSVQRWHHHRLMALVYMGTLYCIYIGIIHIHIYTYCIIKKNKNKTNHFYPLK